ncbi:scavenger receptor cysteine-rich domain-containing group B protein-like [Littorina saxatilis]|uniref:scavenger receptor cysteine-rich domain-containing group B protein-like n=1 Tax=Littorina saxatilis TaxID=31220 RepID=UPI0038B5E24F
MSSLVIILTGVLASGYTATAVTTQGDVFTHIDLDDQVFEENVLFQQPTMTRPHCAALCQKQACCVTFTFYQNVCRGHDALMTSNKSSTILSGARSFARKNHAVEVRLVDGYNNYSGRIEVKLGGTWGTVCSDHFDELDATVFCRLLGFSGSGEHGILEKIWGIGGSRFFGPGSGDILIDDLNCTGYEQCLHGCTFTGAENQNCVHEQDSGAICGLAIRLTNGSSQYEGRVEVRIGPTAWGTVCNDGWGAEETQVLCRELGYPSENATVWPGAYFGQGGGDIFVDTVRCEGNEPALLHCDINWPMGNHNCTHSQDVCVTCA